MSGAPVIRSIGERMRGALDGNQLFLVNGTDDARGGSGLLGDGRCTKESGGHQA